MRDLKFRAWSKERQEYFYSDDGRGFTFRFSPVGRRFIETSCANGHKSIETEPWEQFTGLKDKEGKEIYEGDIVETSVPGSWVVEWSIYQFKNAGYHLRSCRDYPFDRKLTFSRSGKTTLKVIGNIHLNPELVR
jgi:uncharacterized phage protein (TIGR01671 family)